MNDDQDLLIELQMFDDGGSLLTPILMCGSETFSLFLVSFLSQTYVNTSNRLRPSFAKSTNR